MTAPDRRAQDGIDHLQAAARELIAAARAFLDVAEDLVDDPDRVTEAAGTVSDLVRRAGRSAGPPSEWSAAWTGVFGTGADRGAPVDPVDVVDPDHDDDPANDDGPDRVGGPGPAQTDESDLVSDPGPGSHPGASAEAANVPTDLAARRRSARARVRRIAVD